MRGLWEGVRVGCRMLVKNRSSSAIIVLTLALGIGSNAAIFSIIASMLLRPLSVPVPHQIVSLFSQEQSEPLLNMFSIPDFEDIRAQTRDTFSDIAAYRNGIGSLTVDGKPDRVVMDYVSNNFFSTLNIVPARGRFIKISDGEMAYGDQGVVISYAYWKTRFGRDPGVVGLKAIVGKRICTIIGIAPDGFEGMYPVLPTQVY